MKPITLEEVLTQALETLQTFPEISQETLLLAVCAEHPGHAEELRELIPVMFVLDEVRRQRAVELGCLQAACELYAELVR